MPRWHGSNRWLVGNHETTAISLAQQFEDQPVAAIIYTDISRDGMMQGANVTGMAEMKQATSIPVIASAANHARDVKQLEAD